MKRLFQAYLLVLAAAALMMMAGPSGMDEARQGFPQLYWTLAGTMLWTVNGGWFWVLIAWMVYRFTQRRSEPVAPLTVSSAPKAATQLSFAFYPSAFDWLWEWRPSDWSNFANILSDYWASKFTPLNGRKSK